MPALEPEAAKRMRVLRSDLYKQHVVKRWRGSLSAELPRFGDTVMLIESTSQWYPDHSWMSSLTNTGLRLPGYHWGVPSIRITVSPNRELTSTPTPPRGLIVSQGYPDWGLLYPHWENRVSIRITVSPNRELTSTPPPHEASLSPKDIPIGAYGILIGRIGFQSG